MNMDAGEISKKKRVLFYTGLSALMLVVVACTCGQLGSLPGINGSADGEPTPTLITLDGGSDGSDGSGSDTFNFVDPDGSSLTSYHSKFTMTYSGTKEDGTPSSGTFSMEQWHTTDPVASRFTMEGVGDAVTSDREGKTDMVSIGDTTYLVTSVDGKDECLSMQSDATQGMTGDGYSPESFLSGTDMDGARRILPDEIVNGVLSQHWQFTKADVELLTPGWTSYTVDAWTAVDGGYAVKSIFVGDGDNVSSSGGPGHVEWEFNLLEANTDIVIEPPAGCEAPAGADLPQMPDATDVIAMAGFNSYTSASSMSDVVAFYQSEMPLAGWVAGEATISDEISMLSFTKEGKTANITISPSGDTVTVLIQVE